MEPKVELITKQAVAIADVLAKHNVFGVAAEDASEADKADLARWIGHEKQHFLGMVLRRVYDPLALGGLTLNYNDTGAILTLDVRYAFNTALFSELRVVPVLSPNPTLAVQPKIDYEALNNEITAIRESTENELTLRRKLMVEVNVSGIEKDAWAIAATLERHNIFGLERDSLTAEAKTLFVSMVLRQALHTEITEPLVLKYSDTGAWVELDTKVVSGTALFSALKVVPELSPNPTLARNPEIDYEALALEIEFIHQWLDMD